MSNIRVVLDTNVLLVSISRRSIFRPIFDSIIDGKIELIISNEILNEYTEIIERKANATVANNIAEFLINRQNVKKIDIHFRWNLIEQDPDDNKFVDCAIAGRVKYVVTNDKHFQILKDIPFPKVDIISIHGFMKELEDL